MSSGAWGVCPACELRHSPRPDGRCPRCGAEVVATSDAPGAALRPAATAEHPRFRQVEGARGPQVAGGVLVLGGIALALSPVVRDAAPGVVGVAPAAAALVAILLGIWLLRRRLAVAGLILAAGLVLGVVGLPGVIRPLKYGRAPGDEVEGQPVTRLAGPAWSVAIPPDLWYRAGKQSFDLTDAAGRAGDSRAVFEGRLLRIGAPAHLVVVSQRIASDPGLDVEAAAARLADAVSHRLQKWKLLDAGPLPGRGGTRVLHATAVFEGQDVEMLWALYPNAPMLYVVLAAAERPSFPRLRGELEGILASFRSETLPAEPAPPAPY